MRLGLANNDFIRTGILSKKISVRYFKDKTVNDLKLKFYDVMIQVGLHEGRSVAASSPLRLDDVWYSRLNVTGTSTCANTTERSLIRNLFRNPQSFASRRCRTLSSSLFLHRSTTSNPISWRGCQRWVPLALHELW